MTNPFNSRRRVAVAVASVVLILVAYWLWPRVEGVRSDNRAQQVGGEQKVTTPPAPPAPPAPPVPPALQASVSAGGIAAVEVPFLGKVEANASREVVSVQTDSGAVSFPFTVYRRSDGVFLRAVFHKEGAPTFEEPAAKIQRIMKTRDETVTDLPKSAPTAAWQSLVTKFGRDLGEDMSKATEIVVTFVNYKRPDRWVGEELVYETKPVFLIHVYGAATIMEDFPDTPGNRRVRGVYTADGQAVNFDNVL